METKWPKVLPPLTPEQERINHDFMKLWHEVLPKKFGVVERFNQQFPVSHSQKDFKTTLEIGAGLGEHLHYENLTPEQEQNYYALELREAMAQRIRESFPRINAITGDCQQQLGFEDGFFDRVLAIHVLEHLPNLPACIREMHRLCNKERGRFLVVIPCEGGLAYSLARKISAQRVFEKTYKQSYKWFYTREHINLPAEILEELAPYFTIEAKSFFPLVVPVVSWNLCIGLRLVPRVL